MADKSPLPVVVYNYPGAVAGIDLDSEALQRLAEHPNIVGTKFTCGNVGKLARVVANTRPVSDVVEESKASPYLAYAGVADFIAPSILVGGSRAIVGAANVFPRLCVHVCNLAVQGRIDRARVMQQKLARADWSLIKRAIPGFKAILQHYHGYGGAACQPMAALSQKAAKSLCEEMQWAMHLESQLPDVRDK